MVSPPPSPAGDGNGSPGDRNARGDDEIASSTSLERAWRLIHDAGEDDDALLEEAVQILATHLSEAPGDVDAYCLLSEGLLAQGRADESLEIALEACQRAAADNPEPPYRAGFALFDLAALQYDTGEDSDSDDDHEQEARGAPSADEMDEDGLYDDEAEDGDDEADDNTRTREVAIRLQPHLHFIESVLEVPPLTQRTLALQAMEMFAVAAERAPNKLGPHFWMGLCLLNLGLNADASEAFERAVEGEGSAEVTADAWFLHGLTLELLERPKDASEAYRIAQAHEPDHLGATTRLEWLLPEDRRRFLDDLDVDDLRDFVQARLLQTLPENRRREATLEDLAEVCPGELRHATDWARERELDEERLASFLVYHGAASDWEILANIGLTLGLSDDTGDSLSPAPVEP